MSLALSPANAQIAVGDTLQLNAEITPYDTPLIWSSSKPHTVSVDERGLVTGLRPGQAVITVSAGDKTASSVIMVVSKSTPVIPSDSDDSDSYTSPQRKILPCGNLNMQMEPLPQAL